MRATSVLLSLLLLPAVLSASPVADLQPVGEGSLRVLLWRIYDCALYSESGRYRGIEPGLALKIDYRRSISTEQLIERTRLEWDKQSLVGTDTAAWLQRLSRIWPDVARGDEIVLRVGEDLASEFYFNGNFIGEVEDSAFTHKFLAIFLSEQSSYPSIRDRLIGQSAD